MRPLRIVVLAKAPIAGYAKTRLIPRLGARGAAALARRLLAHTLDEALGAGVGRVELCVAPAIEDARRELALPAAVAVSGQGEGDLGARMARAARRAIGAGERVVLIGTDCPQLDRARLRDAAHALERADAVLAPTADGGYALLGLNAFHPTLFEDIAWSTASVAGETLRRMRRLRWRVARQPLLRDIDEPRDLRWLPAGWPEAAPAAL